MTTDTERTLRDDLRRITAYGAAEAAEIGQRAAAHIDTLEARLAKAELERDSARDQFDRHVVWASDQQAETIERCALVAEGFQSLDPGASTIITVASASSGIANRIRALKETPDVE